MSRPRDSASLQREIDFLSRALLEKLRSNAQSQGREDVTPTRPGGSKKPNPDDRGEPIPPSKQGPKSFLDTIELGVEKIQKGEHPLIGPGFGIETGDGTKLTVTAPAPRNQTATGKKRIAFTAAKNSTGETVVFTIGDVDEQDVEPQ